MTDLLPCPFCGGEPSLKFAFRFASEWLVVCPECKINTEIMSKDEVIKRWNTRAPTKADELLEKLLKLSGAPFHQALDEAREYLAKREI